MMIPNTQKLAGHGEYLPESLWEGNPNMADPSRRPYIPSGCKLLVEEPGRRIATALGPVNRVSRNYVLAEQRGMLTLFVKAGDGKQSEIGLYDDSAFIDVLMSLTSDQRFALLAGLEVAHVVGRSTMESELYTAFLEGRMRKKHRGRAVYVEITEKVAA